ncbi:MAG: hypothetical protein NTV21_16535 [Planctomycetota bacterium]|nr:hypothetical protein [Planctomycetota bacterium]
METNATRSLARGFAPLGVPRGDLRAPGSKSLAQRVLLMASLAQGETRIAGLPAGDDVRAAKEVLRAVGCELRELAPAAVSVVGAPPGPHRGWRAKAPLELGESATLARCALGIAGLCGRVGETFELRASGSLVRRKAEALVAALAGAGVEFESRPWPARLSPMPPPPTVRLARASSSQEATALAIALAAWPDELELELEGELPSAPYFEMTLRVLRQFGVRVERRGASVWIRGPLVAPEQPLAIEPDASLSAVALAAACLGGGEVVALGLGKDSPQGDVRVVEHLRAFGCGARFDARGLAASGFPQNAASLDLRGEPDLAPVLAAVAAGAALVDPAHASRLSGLETLPGKESSRIEVLCEGLRAAGWQAEATASELVVRAGTWRAGLERPAEVVLDPHGDHRMAFAFALLGLVRPGVFLREPECVSKSWPSFWKDLAALGVRVEEREVGH